MAYTAKGLAEFAEHALNEPTIYMWGGMMNSITEDFVNRNIRQWASRYKPERIKFIRSKIGKAYGCDCCGLIKAYYFGGYNTPKYDAKKDINTAGMFSVAYEKGPICTIPEEPGIIVYMPGHVGVYIGGGKVIECTLGYYGDGVVKTNLNRRKWTHWLKLPYIEYEKCPPKTPDRYYTVQRGDSLWSISKKFYGTGTLYPEIAKDNGIKNPNIISVGQKLLIKER